MAGVAANGSGQANLDYRIETVDLFDEPQFTDLTGSIFPDAAHAALVQRCLAEAAEGGAAIVRSRHVAANRAIQIAKLKLGFYITGSEYSEEYGLLVRMTCFLREERLRLFLGRSAPLAEAREKGGQW